jgi:hypothetical protein
MWALIEESMCSEENEKSPSGIGTGSVGVPKLGKSEREYIARYQ